MNTTSYSKIKNVWPQFGRHILARYDDSSIVVYQAFCPEIAKYASENGRFGGPKYSFERMTWIKTNFLWMMYRAGWATKKNQERILAITLKKDGFDEILRTASEAKKSDDGKESKDNSADDVRLQWDPDHHPSGAKLIRRAIQLGLRRDILKRFHDEWVIKIEDITEFVHEQYKHVKQQDWDNLLVPEERVYVPEDEAICRHIRLDKVSEGTGQVEPEEGVQGATGGVETDALTGFTNLSCHEGLDAILCLGGAFNPVHSRHIEVMTEVKSWLEENTGYRIIAGLLAVAPDGYVKNKCKGQKCIKAGHRIQLCRLACEHIDWLNPFERPVGSAKESGTMLKSKAPCYFGSRIIVIVGADRAISKSGHAKWHTDSRGVTTVSIGRKGETEAVRNMYEKDLSNGRVKNDSFCIIPKELDNVSSTEVRKKLAQLQLEDSEEGKNRVVMETVDRGWLPENVARYILRYFDDLYLN